MFPIQARGLHYLWLYVYNTLAFSLQGNEGGGGAGGAGPGDGLHAYLQNLMGGGGEGGVEGVGPGDGLQAYLQNLMGGGGAQGGGNGADAGEGGSGQASEEPPPSVPAGEGKVFKKCQKDILEGHFVIKAHI